MEKPPRGFMGSLATNDYGHSNPIHAQSAVMTKTCFLDWLRLRCRLLHDEAAVSMVEYALMVALVAVIVAAAASTLGGGLADTLNRAATTVSGSGGAQPGGAGGGGSGGSNGQGGGWGGGVGGGQGHNN